MCLFTGGRKGESRFAWKVETRVEQFNYRHIITDFILPLTNFLTSIVVNFYAISIISM